MKISYITTYDAQDLSNWSGLGYYISQALTREGHSLNYIGDLHRTLTPGNLFKSAYYKYVQRKGYPLERDLSVVKAYGKQIQARIPQDTDWLFSPGSIPIALLDSKKPTAFYTDATFALMLNFYKAFTNLSAETIRNGNYLEQQAINRSQLAIYSSDWAAESAIKTYGASPDKVAVVPFGANLDSSFTYSDVQRIVSDRKQDSCHLLFLAVDWERKGGALAVKVAEALNNMGLKTTLHIVGIKDGTPIPSSSHIKNHGHISKSSPEGNKLLNQLFAECHFLILPTLADCTPIVFSEANSYGMPCISTNVGGIPTILKEGFNGKTFAVNATAAAYAEYIFQQLIDRELYKELCLSSYNEFQTRLNWESAGKTITRLLNQL